MGKNIFRLSIVVTIVAVLYNYMSLFLTNADVIGFASAFSVTIQVSILIATFQSTWYYVILIAVGAIIHGISESRSYR